MINLRIAILAPIAAAAALVAAPARADQQAESFIAGVLSDANAVFALSDKAARDAGIEEIVDKYVDVERVAKFALGQYARQATEAQLAEYVPLFQKYVTGVYSKSLDDYAGRSLAVTDSVDRSAKDFIVNSKVVGVKPGEKYSDLVVSWRVARRDDGSQKIVDAGAQGVWLAIEQQATFKSVIANNGGGAAGIDALIAELKSRTGG